MKQEVITVLEDNQARYLESCYPILDYAPWQNGVAYYEADYSDQDKEDAKTHTIEDIENNFDCYFSSDSDTNEGQQIYKRAIINIAKSIMSDKEKNIEEVVKTKGIEKLQEIDTKEIDKSVEKLAEEGKKMMQRLSKMKDNWGK